MISVIIPVFNVELYLQECIDSVINQEYKDIEIVLVDDGSTDSSGQICDQYSRSYAKISSFHKENGGLMSAWKYGVAHSSGDYVGFIDSDDYIDPNMFSKLYDAISINKCDIAVCGLVKGGYIYNQSSNYSGAYDVDQLFPTLISTGRYMERGVIPSRVVKLFRRSIIEDAIPFCLDKISIGEDMITTYASFLVAKKVCFIKDFYPYHYRVNVESITQKFSIDTFKKIKIFASQMKYISSKYINYNFDTQLSSDFSCNAINSIERACCSGLTFNEKKQFILKVLNDDDLREALKNTNIKKWAIRYKIYYYLAIKQKYSLILAYGSLIKRMRIVKKKMRRLLK